MKKFFDFSFLFPRFEDKDIVIYAPLAKLKAEVVQSDQYQIEKQPEYLWWNDEGEGCYHVFWTSRLGHKQLVGFLFLQEGKDKNGKAYSGYSFGLNDDEETAFSEWPVPKQVKARGKAFEKLVGKYKKIVSIRVDTEPGLF